MGKFVVSKSSGCNNGIASVRTNSQVDEPYEKIRQ